MFQGVRGQALTHTSNEDKTKLSIVWQAPRVPQGHVVFRYANACIDFNKTWQLQYYVFYHYHRFFENGVIIFFPELLY